MARIYSHKKGKAGSTKPVRSSSPSWVRYSPEEVEQIVLKLRKEGHSTALIGLILRDQYGVPSVKLITKKSITEILGTDKPKIPEDMFNLMVKAVRIRKHLVNAPADTHTRYGLRNTEMKILRLLKYYKDRGVMPAGWKYDPKEAAIIVSGR